MTESNNGGHTGYVGRFPNSCQCNELVKEVSMLCKRVKEHDKEIPAVWKKKTDS